ncbi:MAG: exosortase C-terminal domain/associated protein EpsI [Gemmatimonadaceae bacterium]
MLDVVAKFLPATALAAGTAVTLLVGTPTPTPLRAPLVNAIPATFLGATPTKIAIGDDEVAKSGVSDYINRVYMLNADEGISLYIGYHATQQGDKRMHSPTLCLPGSGWTPIGEQVVTIPVANKPVAVNRFILQNGKNRILVYYWFQGRGRLTAGQGDLKLNAMRDALFTHRDEEALVRIIVPLVNGDSTPVGSTRLSPDSLAARLAETIIEPLNSSLPAPPGA